ncbi:hypothetical protein GJ496_008228 [Pomphorhynchus laevis]|nr:hypothetical protein GJ496_008228 [Pomphorhynchus laevis]
MKIENLKYMFNVSHRLNGAVGVTPSAVGVVDLGANQIMQTIEKCRASRSHLEYNECINQLRQDMSIQIAKCASMALNMRTKAEHTICSSA